MMLGDEDPGEQLAADPAPSPAIEIVLFDVGGVLSEDRVEEKLADLAALHGVSYEQLIAVKDSFRLQADLGQISDADFWRRVLATVGVQATDADVAIDDYITPVPGTLELARTLHSHVRLGILSNDSRELAQARRQRHGFDALFDPIFISSHIGLVKPERQVFEYVLAKLGMPAAACLLIDNRSDNVSAARAAGLRAIQFHTAEQLAAQLRALGLL